MKALKSFFKFYKKERNGILVLFAFILSIQYYLYIDEYGGEESVVLIDKGVNDDKSTVASDTSSTKPTLFYFDPNKIDIQEAIQLGISKKQFENLKNYRKAGGRFNKANDLSKLYTFDKFLCEQLIPYIRLTDEVNIVSLELNSATAEEFQKIKGIGKRLSNRIIRFRDALGGYIYKEQLYEVYGLDTALVRAILPSIRLDRSNVKYIPLNKADLKQLKGHPYISEKDAQAILRYRKKNGFFQHVDGIDLIDGIAKAKSDKIKLYLTVK